MNHQLIDERSLAFHRCIVEKVRASPALVQSARNNLARWMETCSERNRSSLREWEQILAQPLPELLAFLTSATERAARLRQSTPFCGVLNASERLSIIRQYRDRESFTA